MPLASFERHGCYDDFKTMVSYMRRSNAHITFTGALLPCCSYGPLPSSLIYASAQILFSKQQVSVTPLSLSITFRHCLLTGILQQ